MELVAAFEPLHVCGVVVVNSLEADQIVQSPMESLSCIQKEKETGREKLKFNFVRVACRKHSCPRTTHHVHDPASPGRPSRAAREAGKGANNPGPPGVPAGAPFESHPRRSPTRRSQASRARRENSGRQCGERVPPERRRTRFATPLESSVACVELLFTDFVDLGVLYSAPTSAGGHGMNARAVADFINNRKRK